MNIALSVLFFIAVAFLILLLLLFFKPEPCRNKTCSGKVRKMKLIGVDGRFYKVMRCDKCFR